MIIHKEIQKLEKSAVKLTLTIAKDAAKKEYGSLMTRYTQQAVMPGFRKGKVPAAVLEKKFGEGLKAEALQTIIDKALHEVFETIEEKPLSYSQPELLDKDISLDLEKDFTFSLKYDTFPVFTLPNYKGIEIEEPQVSVSKKDEDRELEQIQEQNAMVIDKASGKVARGDTVTVNYVEVDDAGKDVESTRRQDFVFAVGTGYNYYKIDEEIVGFQKDEEKEISMTYPADFEVSELAGTTKKLKVKVTAVKEKKLPEINDDLAQDVSDAYKTLDDLKKAINERLQKTVETNVRQKNIDAVLDKVASSTTFDIPQSMIAAELEQTWRSFAANSRISPEQLEQILGHEAKHKMFDEWKPQSEAALRRRLVMEKILDAEKIECTEDELKVEIQKQADASKISFDEAKDYFDKNGFTHYLEHDVRDKKLGDFLLAQAKIKKGKKMSYEELIGKKQD